MSASHRMPAERFAGFDRRNLDGQFVLCRSTEHVPPGWPARERAGWTLAAHVALPVHTLCARDGSELGWMLGWIIGADGSWLEGRIVLDVASADAPLELAEPSLDALGGRFLAILLTARGARVYMDAGGGVPCVYSPAHQLVAATTSLVPYTHGCDDDVALLTRTGLMSGGPNPDGLSYSLAFGMTSRRNVERLLPNHFLDLATWRVKRHWPAAPIEDDAVPRDVVAEIADNVERQMRAVLSRERAWITLTAGWDSRTLLACARHMLDRIEFFTIALPDTGARIDVAMATRLARRHGLSHRVIPCGKASANDLDQWLWRTGACLGGEREWQAMPAYAALPDKRPEINGFAGGAARAFKWRNLHTADGSPNPVAVVRGLALPAEPEIVARAEAWLKDLPATRAMQIVDLAFLEQRVGSWTSVVPYGHAHVVPFRFAPYVNRRVMTAIFRLPDAYKLEKRFSHDLISSRWPELLTDGINRYPGLAHHKHLLKKRLWRARKALGLAR